MWDFIEECPAFNDEERWIGTNAMLSALHDLPRHVYYWATAQFPISGELPCYASYLGSHSARLVQCYVAARHLPIRHQRLQ